MVQPESGEIVQIPMEHLQPREPESHPEDDDEVRAERQAERKRKREEEIEKIKKMKMKDLGDLAAGRTVIMSPWTAQH